MGFGGGAVEEESPLAATVFNALAGARQAGGGAVRVAELLLAEDFAVVLLAEGDWDGLAVAAPPLWIASEKDAKLAQKLGQLQPFTAVFPRECMGQPASSGPT